MYGPPQCHRKMQPGIEGSEVSIYLHDGLLMAFRFAAPVDVDINVLGFGARGGVGYGDEEGCRKFVAVVHNTF